MMYGRNNSVVVVWLNFAIFLQSSAFIHRLVRRQGENF
jgi:hypothetical protein